MEAEDLEQILAELRENRGRFPRQAIVAAVERRHGIVPHLLEAIESARRRADDLPPEFLLHVYAMYLLAQFRERTALRPILDFLSLPGRQALDLTGDVVTEDMQRILASVAHGEIEPMVALVRREELDEYIRSAVLQGVVACHLCGELPKERICSVLDELFDGLERRPSMLWATLAIACAELSLPGFRPQIERVFDAGLIDDWIVGRDELLSELEAPTPLRRPGRYGLIEDTVAELEWWACFQPERDLEAAVGTAPKVRRNDPCPCGSGVKYKKCCMTAG